MGQSGTAAWGRTALVAIAALTLQACSSLGASGPSRSAVQNSAGKTHANADIKVIELDDQTARRVALVRQGRDFAGLFGNGAASGTVIGRGDTLEISIWEAPPAVLFGTEAVTENRGRYGTVAQNAALPAQMVGDEGTITVPFVGQVRAAGRSTAQIEREIRAALAQRAHDPQVVVRLALNEARNVTVLGEVATSRRVPLSARGERLLDVIAAAGGSRHPVGKTTVQIARGTSAAVMPLERVIRDPEQNVRLRSDDVVTVLFEPYSFIALGAVIRNAEIPFEGSGLSLAQALGRMGGLRDDRADIRGIFIFRLEDPAALEPELAATARRTADGRVPVIYRLNLADASRFFAAQDFEVRDKDVLYVSAAPAADLQKFLGTVSNIAFTTIGIANLVK